MVNYGERSRSHTPGIQCITGPPMKVYFGYTHPKCTVRVLLLGTVQIRTAGVRKFRSLQISAYGVVNCRERSRCRTPDVKCATVPPRWVSFVYTQPKCTVRVLLWGTVRIRAAGVRKYRLLHITVHGVVNCRERSRWHTPGLHCATGPPR